MPAAAWTALSKCRLMHAFRTLASAVLVSSLSVHWKLFFIVFLWSLVANQFEVTSGNPDKQAETLPLPLPQVPWNHVPIIYLILF